MSEMPGEALDAIWTAVPDARASVAQVMVQTLTPGEVDALSAWDFSATFDQRDFGQLSTSREGGPNETITYSDAPFGRQTVEPRPVIHGLATLLLIAQFARDHIDGLLMLPPPERDRRIAQLAETWDVDEARLRRLLSSFPLSGQTAR